MSCRTVPLMMSALVVVVWSSCVSVDTPDTKVQVGITQVNMPGSEPPDPNAAPYAKPLKKVVDQQAKVARQISQSDWEDLVERSNDWLDQVRELTAYAGTSHDPRLFRRCCQELDGQVQSLRQAALRRDAAHVQRAFDACDPPLARLVQSFPRTRPPAQAAAVGSPAPPAPPAPQPARPTPTANPPRVP